MLDISKKKTKQNEMEVGVHVKAVKHTLKCRPGSFVDIGVPPSVVDVFEVCGLVSLLQKKIYLCPPSKKYRSTDETYKFLDSTSLLQENPVRVLNIYVPIDFVTADGTALIVLDVMHVPSLTADTAVNRLVKRAVNTSQNGQISSVQE